MSRKQINSAFYAAVFCAGMASVPLYASVTSRSYVQKGLVVQYDGIDNAGIGLHDPLATIWKNLAGDPTLDAVKGENVSWGANGWTNNRDGKPFRVGTGLAKTTGSGSFTLQFACTPSRDDIRQSFFSQYDYTSAYGGIGVEHNDGSSPKTGKIRLYRFKENDKGTNFDKLTPVEVSKDVFSSASIEISTSRQVVWLNGTTTATNTAAFGIASSACPSVIGGEPQRDSMAFYGTYNAFRLYDRVLSAAEEKVNAAVDAIRFANANPSDFTLEGGYSFDGAGDLCVTVSASVSDRGGMVAVAGGGPSVTVKQHGTADVAATAAEGYVFIRWEGDTAAIVSGSVYVDSITVKASAPVSLVAVFAPVVVKAAHLYVQDGIVAQYDGIDNSGNGSHSATATEWADLSGSGYAATMGESTSWNGADGWVTSGNTKPFTIPAPGIASTLATTNFTIQFACKPGVANKRMCYFGQYKTEAGVNIEQSTAGKLRFYRNSGLGQSSAYDWPASSASVVAGSFLSAAYCVSPTQIDLYHGGSLQQTRSGVVGDVIDSSDSVIGGEVQAGSARSSLDATYGITFRGTYHAFRVYERVLSPGEIAWNANLDAVRFNGADASATLGNGYSYDAASDTLSVAVFATATAGGSVSYRGGNAVSSVSAAVACNGEAVSAFVAVPDAGYVFDRWSGDVSVIAQGSILTPQIVLAPDRPASLVANFRRNGDAADGLVSSLSFTGDIAADGGIFTGAVGANGEEAPGFKTADVLLPIQPTVTNEAVACLYLPQPSDTSAMTVFRQDARFANAAATGSVATVFCRFRWDGSVLPSVVNYPAVVLSGYTSWGTANNGFVIRLRAAANETKGYFALVVPGHVVNYNASGITDVSGEGFVEAGEWVDLIASVYPSPTDPVLANVDIWYCREPVCGSSGFSCSTIGHRHFGDGCAITNLATVSTRLAFGSEPNPVPEALVYSSGSDNAIKCFRGVVAGAKVWNRLLSEQERWTVMAGFDGVQSWPSLDSRAERTFETERMEALQGYNGTATAFVGDNETDHFWRAMTTTHNSLTLVWNAPKDSPSLPVLYKTSIRNAKSGTTHPIHLEVNGVVVWSSSGVVIGDEIEVEIDEALTLPGLNELKWVYDTPVASNWVQFMKHWLRVITPPKGTAIFLK